MDTPILIDLGRIDARNRKTTWCRAVPTLFPGFTIDDFRDEPAVGVVRGSAFGGARFWEIASGPVNVGYSPHQASSTSLQAFSLMLQLSGETNASQNGRTCSLTPGDFCLIDNDSPFRLVVRAGFSKILVVHLPRSNVLNRHPQLQRMTATKISSNEEGGARVLRDTLKSILAAAPYLCETQQWNAVALLLQSLSLLTASGEQASSSEWRVRRALGVIETRLSDPFLTAEDVAHEQSLSRRQLDRIFKKELGVTVATQIWERRLQYAASLLCSRTSRRSVTEIALASGFQDVSHFSRAFRQRFGMQPSKWHAISTDPELTTGVRIQRTDRCPRYD